MDTPELGGTFYYKTLAGNPTVFHALTYNLELRRGLIEHALDTGLREV